MRTPEFSESGIELHNCDCIELMKEMPDKSVDLAICDPPYGMETTGNAQDRFRMGHDLSLVNDAKPSALFFTELFRVSRNQIIWGYNHLSDMLPSCREFVFWNKRNPVPTFSDGELAWTSFKKTAVCFEFPFDKAIRSNGQKIHPTQKPTELYSWLLNKYATPEMTILDTHFGSCSIGIACRRSGNPLTACEIDAEYFKAATERITRELDQKLLAL